MTDRMVPGQPAGLQQADRKSARRADVFPLLAEALEQLISAETGVRILEVLSTFARRLVQADGVAIVLRDGEHCRYAHAHSHQGPLWEGQRFPLTSCISGWAMLEHQTAVIADVFQDPRIPHEIYRTTFVRSLVMVPVGRRIPVAAIGTYWAAVRTPDSDEVAVLETLARAAGGALERCAADEQIRSSEQWLRSMFNNTLVGLGVASVDGTIVEANARYADMLGYTRGELMGRSLFELPHSDDLSLNRILINKLVAGDMRHFHLEQRYRHKSGRVVWINNYFWRMNEVDDKPSRLASAVLDITVQKDAEDRLSHAQRMDALGQLTSGIAHDFNNLLTVINGSAEMLAEAVKDLPDALELACIVQAAGEKGAVLTERLLSFARHDALDPRPCRPDELIAAMRGMLRRTLREDVALCIDLSCPESVVVADHTQFEVAILNLVLNARDAMPQGGSLTIATSNATDDGGAPWPCGGPVPASGYVAVCVSDTGTGMADSVRARAFEPFFTTKPKGMGTGLGLSMVYGFARQSDGQASIDSQPGKGTTVRLLLPAVHEQPSPGSREMAACPMGGGERIMVVEDDDSVRAYVVRALGALGYCVDAAACAAEALQLLARQTDYDLLLTDMVMPGGLNGLELGRAALRLRPGLKILLSTGYADQRESLLDQELLVPLLHKPYRRAELATKLREVLETPAWSDQGSEGLATTRSQFS